MVSLNWVFRFVAVAVAAVAVLAGASTGSQAQSGRVRLHIVKAGFIVGIGGGSGILTYHGRTYRLCVGGIGVGSLWRCRCGSSRHRLQFAEPWRYSGHLWGGRRGRCIRRRRTGSNATEREGRCSALARGAGRLSGVARSGGHDHRATVTRVRIVGRKCPASCQDCALFLP